MSKPSKLVDLSDAGGLTPTSDTPKTLSAEDIAKLRAGGATVQGGGDWIQRISADELQWLVDNLRPAYEQLRNNPYHTDDQIHNILKRQDTTFGRLYHIRPTVFRNICSMKFDRQFYKTQIMRHRALESGRLTEVEAVEQFTRDILPHRFGKQ